MRLEGRVAVVTGGASGIGRAIAIKYAEEGARVLVSDIRQDPIWAQGDDRPTAEVITAAGGDARYVQADVSKAEDVDRLITFAAQEYGRLDVLVNSAAVFESTTILETSEDDWDAVMRVNLRGAFLACKRAIAEMLSQPPRGEVRGRIVNVTSQHGMVGPPAYFAYAVSKAGLVQITRQLAVDYAKHGILVNAVAPGRIMTGTHPGEAAYLESGEVDEDTEYSLARTPFPRLGEPRDVAGAALFLASDDCSYVSGHNLLVDGGWMAY